MTGRTEGAGEIGKGSVHEAGLKRKGAGSGKREAGERGTITQHYVMFCRQQGANENGAGTAGI